METGDTNSRDTSFPSGDGDSVPENRNLLEAGAAARIRALDAITATSLRKCQVINKVSDIVRELVENSLDAGSTTVQVYLEKFGADKIEVRDNGHGIQSSDVTHIFQGGYTSKLQDTSNLSRGNFFGFKGEALNAMCAAGNVTVVSKLPNESTASKYKFDFLGKVISETRVAHGEGTTVTVEKLFEGIRVRRQMIENETRGANDLKEIEAYLKGVAVANPKCHLSLYHNTNSVWSKPSVQTVGQALFAVFGHNIAKRLERVGPMRAAVTESRKGPENNMATTVEMYLPKKPVDMRTMSFTSNKLAMIFCNRKRVYIREFEKLIHRYVTSVVEKPQPSDQRRFPISVLCIDVPPAEADFNRNIDKTKVFLVNKDAIRDAVEDALSKFYGIDLRESAVEADLPNSTADKSGGQNEAQKQKDKFDRQKNEENSAHRSGSFGVQILPPTSSSAVDGRDRESTIGSFLQDIPSKSSAFTQSPSKAPNAEPVIVEFPVSKPTVDLTSDTSEKPSMLMESIKKSRGGSVVANFEISIDSQELEFEENGETGTSKGEANLNSRDLSKIEEERGSKEFQDWLQGTIKDKHGDVIESVRTVNEVAKDYNHSTERFRSALVTSTPVPSRSNKSSGSEQPISSFFSPLQPPTKRPRSDAFGNHPVVPPPAALLCQTPRMSTPTRQVTLNSLTNWPTSTGGFSQVASRAGVGVRIPLTPTAPRFPANSPGSYFSNPKSNQNVVPKLATPFSGKAFVPNEKSRGLPLPSNYSSGKLTPKIHKEFEGSVFGHLYIAQTFDSIGIFSPHKMIEYFPEESRECWSPTDTYQNTFEDETLSLTFEDVSRLFQQFCTRSEINCAPVARKIFHALSKLPELTLVINKIVN